MNGIKNHTKLKGLLTFIAIVFVISALAFVKFYSEYLEVLEVGKNFVSIYIKNLNTKIAAYFITTLDAIVRIILIHGLLGFCWNISKFLPDILINGFTMLSKHVTGIYVAQWYFIPLFMTFIEYFYKGIVFTESSITLISIFILGISTLAALSYSKYKKIIN